MSMQPPTAAATAPAAFQPASHGCFTERDALVTSCEIKVRRVDTTQVRKMRRRARRLRWAAPPLVRKSKREDLEPRTAVPTTSPSQVILPLEKSNLAGSRQPNSPTPEPRPAHTTTVPNATEASTAPPAVIASDASRQNEPQAQQNLEVSGVAASRKRPPGHGTQYGVDTTPSDNPLAQDASTRHAEHGQPVKSSCRADGPPARSLADDKLPDRPTACESTVEQASDRISSVRDTRAQQTDQIPLGAKRQLGGKEPPPIHKDWTSTPVDHSATWIGHVLDGRLEPSIHRARWVDETIQSATDNCVAHLQRRATELQRWWADRARSGTERQANAAPGAVPQPSAKAEGMGPTNPRVGLISAAEVVRPRTRTPREAPRPSSPRRSGPAPTVEPTKVSALATTTRTWGVLAGNPFAPLADEPEEEATPACNTEPETGKGARAREGIERERGGTRRKRGTRKERRPWTLEDYVQPGSILQRRKRKGLSSHSLVHDRMVHNRMRDGPQGGTKDPTGEGPRRGRMRHGDSARRGTATRTVTGESLGRARDADPVGASDFVSMRVSFIRDGLVSDRIREWSSRDYSTEETEEVVSGPGGMILCRQKFDGLQGRLSDHIQWRVLTVRRSARDRMRRRNRYAEYLKRLPHTEPPSPQTELPAANSALRPNDWTEPERLQLTIELSGRTIAVQAEETDWEWAASKGPRAVSGAWAVEWTVATALQRVLGSSERAPRPPVEPFLNGRRVQAWLEPSSWGSLKQFARIGGQYRVTTQLQGGMDPDHSALLTEVKLCATLGWAEIDANYTRIQNAEDPGPDIAGSGSWVLARALMAKGSLGQMESLAALPLPLLSRAQMSPARIVALQVVMERKAWDPVPMLPSWVLAKDWVEVRFNNVQTRELLPGEHHSHSFRQMQTAVFATLQESVAALASFGDWEDLRPETKVDGDLRAKAEYIGITTVLPTGSWIEELLKGRITLTTASYMTLSPRDGFCEAVLDGPDSRLLICIGIATRQSIPAYCALLNGAFRDALHTDLVLTRITTSKWAGGGKGQKGKATFHKPTDEQAEIAIGISVISLILQRRKGPTLLLNLGREGEFPIQVRIRFPEIPLRTLYEMVHAKSLPLRCIGLSTEFDCRVLCYGPRPKGWLAREAVNAGERTALKRHLRLVFETHVNATTTRLIGRYSGKLGGPIILYLEFGSTEASRSFNTAARTGQLPAEVQRATAPFNDGNGHLYTSAAPAEALEMLKEKELLTLLEQARSPEVAWPIPPPAHPPPPDAGPQEA